jgi:hypothetical protein
MDILIKESPIQKCLKLIKLMRDKAMKEDVYHSFLALEYCYLTLQNHLIDEDYYYFSENDLVWAVQEAYGHGRDEAEDVLHEQVEYSIQVILKTLKDKKIVR